MRAIMSDKKDFYRKKSCIVFFHTTLQCLRHVIKVSPRTQDVNSIWITFNGRPRYLLKVQCKFDVYPLFTGLGRFQVFYQDWRRNGYIECSFQAVTPGVFWTQLSVHIVTVHGWIWRCQTNAWQAPRRFGVPNNVKLHNI